MGMTSAAGCSGCVMKCAAAVAVTSTPLPPPELVVVPLLLWLVAMRTSSAVHGMAAHGRLGNARSSRACSAVNGGGGGGGEAADEEVVPAAEAFSFFSLCSWSSSPFLSSAVAVATATFSTSRIAAPRIPTASEAPIL